MFQDDCQYSYGSVKRWANNVAGGDVFALKQLIIPVNIGNSHWCLCVAHVQEKRIQFYCSMGGSGAHYCEGLRRFFADEAKKWRGKDAVDLSLLDVESWNVVGTTAPGTPRQLNGLDCGAFICYFANYLSVDAALTFNQANITSWGRRRMTLDILRKLVT